MKYRYARNRDGVPIDIVTLAEEERDQAFFCIACKGLLTPKMGLIRERHFAHKADVSCTEHPRETYLHQLAKLRFYDSFVQHRQEGKPFLLELEQSIPCGGDYHVLPRMSDYVCRLERQAKRRFNLLDHYDELDFENRFGDFTPDLLLKSSQHQDVILIEIKVSHGCSQKKIDSGFKILEYQIRSEADIDRLCQGLLTDEDPALTLYNFRRQTAKDQTCPCHKTPVYLFTLFKSGKGRLARKNLGYAKTWYETRRHTVQWMHVETIDKRKGTIHPGVIYTDLMVEARHRGHHVDWDRLI